MFKNHVFYNDKCDKQKKLNKYRVCIFAILQPQNKTGISPRQKLTTESNSATQNYPETKKKRFNGKIENF